MSVIITPTPGSDACIILLFPIYIPTGPILVRDVFLYITKSPGCKSFFETSLNNHPLPQLVYITAFLMLNIP